MYFEYPLVFFLTLFDFSLRYKSRSCSELKTIISCADKILSLSCGNSEKITIKQASYGRSDTKTCSHRGNVHDTSCSACSSLKVLKGECEGKASCSVLAENKVFGDPCVGTFKYLNVTYSCTKGQCL